MMVNVSKCISSVMSTYDKQYRRDACALRYCPIKRQFKLQNAVYNLQLSISFDL